MILVAGVNERVTICHLSVSSVKSFSHLFRQGEENEKVQKRHTTSPHTTN